MAKGWYVEIVRSNIPEYNDTEWENILIGPFEDQAKAIEHADMSADVEDWCYGEAKAKGYNVDDVLIVCNPTLIPSYGINAPVYPIYASGAAIGILPGNPS